MKKSIGKMERNNYSSETELAANMSQALLTDAMVISVGAIVVFENIVAMFILYRCRNIVFQVKILSMNLVLSDVFTGIILCLPLSVYQYGEGCEFKKYLVFLFVNVSLFTVTTYNLDRCLVFALNMKYYKYVTKLRLIFLCGLFWITGVITSYLMFYSEDLPFKIGCKFMYELKRNPVSQSTKYLLLSIMASNIFMHVYLLHYIRKWSPQIAVARGSSSPITDQQTDIVKNISVITGTFLTIATPFYITLTFPILDYSKPLGQTIHNICGMLLILNSAMNPVFYIWRMEEPRYQLKLLIMKRDTAYCEKLRQEYHQNIASFNMTTTSNL